MLPDNVRRPKQNPKKVKIWAYGLPMAGKSVFADQFPNVIHCNTDGNVTQLTGPVFVPKEKVVNGKVALSAWESFKDFVRNITSGDHTFETISIDLVEDIYTYCREHYQKEMGIDHESDAAFGKGYDVIRKDFLITMGKLAKSPYNIIMLSHLVEAPFKTRGGFTKTALRTPLSDKIANKLAGLVDVVARIYRKEIDYKGLTVNAHMIQISNEAEIFGGTRLTDLHVEEMELNVPEFLNVLGLDIKVDNVQNVTLYGVEPTIIDSNQPASARPKPEPIKAEPKPDPKPEPVKQQEPQKNLVDEILKTEGKRLTARERRNLGK